ncbi:MAG: PA2779 family protein, partial [Nitrospirota bacterium]
MKIPCMKYWACYLAFVMFLIGISPRVYAGLAPSEIVIISHFDRGADLQSIQKVLETKVIRERLEALGFTEKEIHARFDQLTDSQIHELAQNIDQLTVGGDGLGLVIGLLVI